MKKKMLAAAVLMMALAGCYKDNVEDMYPATSRGGNCDTTNVTFSGVVKPIIDAKCATAGCHINASTSGISLADYHGVAGIASSGKLLAAITHSGQASFMPKGQAKLDDCTIAKITKWVNDGAPDN